MSRNPINNNGVTKDMLKAWRQTAPPKGDGGRWSLRELLVAYHLANGDDVDAIYTLLGGKLSRGKIIQITREQGFSRLRDWFLEMRLQQQKGQVVNALFKILLAPTTNDHARVRAAELLFRAAGWGLSPKPAAELKTRTALAAAAGAAADIDFQKALKLIQKNPPPDKS